MAARRSPSRVRLGLVWLAVLVAPFAAPAGTTPEPGSDIELDVLMRHLATSGTVRADFIETRRISLLTDGIETRGVLYFAPTDRLARYTTHPGPSRVVVNGDRVSFRDAAGERSLDLGSNAVVRSLLENLMVLLRGDLGALRERYTLVFRAAGPEWTLALRPRAEAVRALVERVWFSGRGGVPHSMETRETNGDSTLLVFSNVETRLGLAPGELERIFSVASGKSSGEKPATLPGKAGAARAPRDPAAP